MFLENHHGTIGKMDTAKYKRVESGGLTRSCSLNLFPFVWQVERRLRVYPCQDFCCSGS